MTMFKSIIHDPDIDPQETQEWLEALASVVDTEGVERAHYLVERMIDQMRRSGAHLPFNATTAYINTIHESRERKIPRSGFLPNG